MAFQMIVATNRKSQEPDHCINEQWSDKPEKIGHLHWIIVSFEIDSAGRIQIKSSEEHSSTSEKLPTKISELLSETEKQPITAFCVGARSFHPLDFVNFHQKIKQQQLKGTVVGFSPAFSAGVDVVPIRQEFKKSHLGRASFANFLKALEGKANPLSLVLQSASNDLCARTFEMLGKGNLPAIKRIACTGSAIARESLSQHASAQASKPKGRVKNAHHLVDSCEYLRSYYREDDSTLKLLPLTLLLTGPRPLGLKPPREPYGHPDKTTFVDCHRVTVEGGTTHLGYEKNEVILNDIAAFLNAVGTPKDTILYS